VGCDVHWPKIDYAKSKLPFSKTLPVPGANIYFEGTFDGCTSDASGNYNLTTSLMEEQTLIVSFMGFETFTQLVELTGETFAIDITLKEMKKDLGEVVITVGTFAAGDESKSPTPAAA
jgi:hypothetical protein